MHERLRVLLAGTKSTVSALRVLDGYADLIATIWYCVLTPIERCMGTEFAHTWDQEWKRAVVESVYGYDCVDSLSSRLLSKLFEEPGICQFERVAQRTETHIESQAHHYVLCVHRSDSSGITVDEYKAYIAYEKIIKTPIQTSILQNSTRYTALVHNWYNCLVKLAASTEAMQRHSKWGYTPLYSTITGKRGLQNNDNTWASLLCADTTVGHEFVTRADADFIQPFKYNFSMSSGMSYWIVNGNSLENQVVDSDVVCLENFVRDGDVHRSAIQMKPSWLFKLPPFSTIKVVDIKKPGEWQPYPYKVNVQRRLFVVRVSFALAN